jgi:hypothetical protein
MSGASRIQHHLAKDPAMPTSEARINSNRMNSLKSSGPKSPSGKIRSRSNSLKHGLTGQGVVIAEEDRDAVERRAEALEAELGPKSTVGQVMIHQMAVLSVRMERSAKQESATIAGRVRHSLDAFDEARFDEAEQLFDRLAEAPRVQLRQLMKSPEGVDRLVVAWRELRSDLTLGPAPVWTDAHLNTASNLLGLRADQAQWSRIGALSKAAQGDFAALAGQEPGLMDLDLDDRKAWALGLLVEQVDAEIAELEAHYETLDFEAIGRDRAEAPDRALFDPSKEATLARRYESEARRGFFKALKEFHKAEAEALERAESAPAPAAEIAPPREPLASFREKRSSSPRDPQPTPQPTAATPDRPILDRDGQPFLPSRAVPAAG